MINLLFTNLSWKASPEIEGALSYRKSTQLYTIKYINTPQDKCNENMFAEPLIRIDKIREYRDSFEIKNPFRFQPEHKEKSKSSPAGKIWSWKNNSSKMILGFTKPAEGTLYFQTHIIDSKICWKPERE